MRRILVVDDDPHICLAIRACCHPGRRHQRAVGAKGRNQDIIKPVKGGSSHKLSFGCGRCRAVSARPTQHKAPDIRVHFATRRRLGSLIWKKWGEDALALPYGG